MSDKLGGKITISRPAYRDGRELVSIRVKCESSRATFLEVEMGLDQFAKCITGRSEVDCTIKPDKLDRVGKIKVSKDIVFPFLDTFDYENRKVLAEKVALQVAGPEWKETTGFSSQGSFFKEDGVDYARTTVNKWEDQ